MGETERRLVAQHGSLTMVAHLLCLGQPSSVNDGSGVVSYGFEAAGNPTSVVLPDGVSSACAWDRASRLAAGPLGSLSMAGSTSAHLHRRPWEHDLVCV